MRGTGGAVFFALGRVVISSFSKRRVFSCPPWMFRALKMEDARLTLNVNEFVRLCAELMKVSANGDLLF